MVDIKIYARINHQETRILELEKLAQARHQIPFFGSEGADLVPSAQNNLNQSKPQTFSPSETIGSHSGTNEIDTGPPIATLRSIRAFAKDEITQNINSTAVARRRYNTFDPVTQGLLTAHDIQRTIDMYSSPE